MEKEKVAAFDHAENLFRNDAGMMTVEASVIVPLLAFIVLITVFMSVLILDLSVAKSETMIVANEAAQCWQSGGDLSSGEYDKKELLGRSVTYTLTEAGKKTEEKAGKRFADRLKERFMLVRPTGTDLKTGVDRITLSVDLSAGLPFRTMSSLFGSEAMGIGASSTACYANWEETIRLATVLKKNK